MKIKQGLYFFPSALSKNETDLIRKEVSDIVKVAPFFKPKMPKTGKEFSVAMTNAGGLGWVSDQDGGYRYQQTHPETQKPWPKIPEIILTKWRDYAKVNVEPDCCLINRYDLNAKMGLHVDNDEEDFSYPVMSISLGASALFRIGGLQRKDKTSSIKLNDGDIVVFGGDSRLIYHGIDRVYKNSGFDYRYNLTLRKVI